MIFDVDKPVHITLNFKERIGRTIYVYAINGLTKKVKVTFK